MSVSDQKIFCMAKVFREGMETFSKSTCYTFLSSFPAGCCGYTSWLLAKYFKSHNINTVYVCGKKEQQSHAWLVIKDTRIKNASFCFPKQDLSVEFVGNASILCDALESDVEAFHEEAAKYVASDLTNGLIVDITADQFGEVPVYVGYNNEFYKQYEFSYAHDMEHTGMGDETTFDNIYNEIVTIVNSKQKTALQRRKNMQAVKNKDSKIELLLRQALWARGLRYQKNRNDIFGKPDIVFKGKKIAVFCDSEFWHGYNWEERKKDFKSHQEFWIPKIERNIQRDIEVTEKLKSEGWTVLRFWGNEIKKKTMECADIIEKAVISK